MREKSDASKIREGRGIISDDSYAAWKLAREAKSRATSCMMYDPISKRSVSCLSQLERHLFWLLRFSQEVDQVYEQFPMDKGVVDALCQGLGYHKYNKILSTDFLVKKTDGTYHAISVKPSKDVFDVKKHSSAGRTYKRQAVEKAYWENAGIPWTLVTGDKINPVIAVNISSCMVFWDKRLVTDETSMLKHLIAHHKLVFPMDKPIPFVDVAKSMDVRRLYEDYLRA